MKREQAIEYLKMVVGGLVNYPEDIKIESELNILGLVLNIKANEKDMRYLIGNKGRTAWALRALMEQWGKVHIAEVKVLIGDVKAEEIYISKNRI